MGSEITTFFIALYLLIFLPLAVYGFHRIVILFLYYKHRKKRDQRPPQVDPQDYPSVTIQLPIYNELYVAQRVINAVSQFNYPKKLMHIQILDDSTDQTVEITRNCASRLLEQGYQVTYHHRADRKDYKAGALQEGLLLSNDNLVAIFDADFIPPPNFLERVIPYFQDRGVGMVQARWGYINEDYSLLTRIQAMLLDGHFILEHTARYFSGRFFNFNGTAGIWRRQAILESGGWQGDTLTEDLDLSYRAQLNGWRFVFLPDLICPSELPVEIFALKNQQHRWTKGSIQTCKKLLPRILQSALPLPVKIEAALHLSVNINYPLLALLTVLIPPSLLFRYYMGMDSLILFELPLFVLTIVSIAVFSLMAQIEQGRDWKQRILYVPLIMAFGIGICLHNARAVIEALRSKPSPFVRTAKYGIETTLDGWKEKAYQTLNRRIPIMEAGMALYLTGALGLLVMLKNWGSLPLVLLFITGYSYVFGLSLIHAKK